MTNTGVKCSAEELVELRNLANEAARTPAITLTSGTPDWASRALERCLKRTHEIALSHGLPEITGYYGITFDGEFVRT